jgi:hypothetical protein
MPAKKKTEVELPGQNFSPEDLTNIQSFEDALTLVQREIGAELIVSADQAIGDGFKLLENKDVLQGVEMLLVSWDFHLGDFGEFVSVKLVTRNGDKYILNDGSSGIRDQLMGFTAKKNQKGGLFCKKGLRRSDYTYQDEKGQETPATTYYLDTSA